MVIQVGDSTAAVKQEISDLLEYVTGDGEITSWLNATNRINGVADLLGRDGIADGMAGATARARINALWGGPTWAPGATMALNWLDGRYFRGVPDLTRPTNATDDITGTLETYAPDVLRRADGHGALLERQLEKVGDQNPVDVTTWTSLGGPDRATLPNEGGFTPQEITSSGNAWGGVQQTGFGIPLGQVLTARIRYRAGTSGRILITAANGESSGGASNSPVGNVSLSPWMQGRTNTDLGGGLYEATVTWQVTNDVSSYGFFRIGSGVEGGSIIVVGCQITLGPSSGAWVPMTGSVTVAADLLTVPVQDGGRAFVFQYDNLDHLGPGETRSIIFMGTGNSNDFLYVANRSADGNLVGFTRTTDGGSYSQTTMLSGSSEYNGLHTLYGYIRDDGRFQLGLVEGNEMSLQVGTGRVSINQIGFGILNSISSNANNANIRAHRFMEILNPPDPEAAFAQVRAVAEGWAA